MSSLQFDLFVMPTSKFLFIAAFLAIINYSVSFASEYIQRGPDIDGEAEQDLSGWSVSLNSEGNVVAIGAIFNDETGNSSGHVRVYGFDSDAKAWIQRGDDIEGEALGDVSGGAVSLSDDGNIVAIGAFQNGGNGALSGHVRVFEYNAGSGIWTQRGDDLDGEAAGDSSGFSVSLSADGNVVAIGAPDNDGVGSSSGHVRVFEYDSGLGLWNQLGTDIDGEAAGDGSGWSVSLSSDGTVLAIGASSNGGSGVGSGHVRVYLYDSGSGDWIQRGADIDGEMAGESSGFSVSLNGDGDVLAIGAPTSSVNGTESGQARVFAYDSGTAAWTQRGNSIDGEAAGDSLGGSVSLSVDGNLIAVGAVGTDSIGSNSGLVRVYQYDSGSGAWIQREADIDGEAAEDRFGESVSLNSDGGVIAVGATFNDGNGSDSGHVRIFNLFFDTADLAAAEIVATETGRILGRSDVTSSPSSYSLFTADDVASAESVAMAAGRELGQSDVVGSPSSYDLFTVSQFNSARTIVNVSARVVVGVGETIIPGFVVLGESKRFLIRAVGPKLVDLGVSAPLDDPTMTVFKTRFDGNPADEIIVVDDWKEGDADVEAINAAMESAGAFPLEPVEDFQGSPMPTDDTKSAATLITLSEGVYTIVVTSVDNGEGEVLVEVYEVID